VPVAEPSGEYTVTCSVDLSPLFGKIVSEKKITITQPPADILEKRLAELRSDNEQTRISAAHDLAHFQKDAERVFPALQTCFGSADDPLKNAAFNSMGSYADQIAVHFEFFIKILGDSKHHDSIRARTVMYLSGYGPIDPRIQTALDEAKEALKASDLGPSLKYYIDHYASRSKEASD